MMRAFPAILLALVLGAPVVMAGGTSQSYGGAESAADRELTRRQENIVLAEEALRRGDTALRNNDVEGAYRAYKEAVDLAPDGSAAGSLHSRALARFSSTAVAYAEFLVGQGQYAKAESVAREVLEPSYNPDYRPAAMFLSRLESPDYFNKTITPEFAQDRTRIEELLTEANGFFDSGRYDMAEKRYQQVLQIDKYNAAAFRGLEQVEVGKQRYYDSAYNETRSRMLWQVDKAWERPKRRFVEARATDSTAVQDEKRGTEMMIARLNRIIIPRVDFRDATVRQAVTFLQQRSRELEATDGDQRGINIVLKLPTVPPPTPVAAEGSLLDGGTGAPAPLATAESRITLNLTNVPLYEALRYVATLAGLKVKVEPFAVSIVPLSEPTDTLEQREFKVPPGFITATAATGEPTAFAGAGEASTTAGKLGARANAREFLETQGVEFPPGASANFIPGSSKLVVRNTAANLDLIESLVDAAMGEQPTQVEIEAKFVEVSQDNLKELGFDWALGPFSIPGSDAVFGSGGSAIGQGSSAWPFVAPDGTVVGTDSVTSGLRTGDAAIAGRSLDALLANGSPAASINATQQPAPGVFSISGVFTNPQFQVVLRALNQKKGVDLMAAPKVTTKSGQKATITISREFPYPETYAPPQVPQNTDSGTSVSIIGAGRIGSADVIVTPAFPQDFTTRKLGVTLEVEPQIGPDGYTIDLNLTPEVVDFDGFINYGSPIFAAAPVSSAAAAANLALNPLSVFDTSAAFRPQLLTTNTINQPVFSVRKVTTNVSIWDGQTVALGGLISENVQKVNDKVPVLGDIPYAGVLFRSEVDQKIKNNLIVFVTARLMDAAGQALRPESDLDQEEIVEPLGLPQDLRKPSVNPKGFTQK